VDCRMSAAESLTAATMVADSTFCEEHHSGCHGESYSVCPRCANSKAPYKHPKPEHPDWMRHVLADPTWKKWRKDNPQEVAEFRRQLAEGE
jgi:hypothetical protein